MAIQEGKFLTVWNASKSSREAAKRLNVSVESARNKAWRLRKLGYEVKRHRTRVGRNKEQHKKVLSLREEGLSMSQIAQQIGVTKQRVSQIIKANTQ